MLETQLKLRNCKHSCLRTHTLILNESCWFYHNSTTASVVLLCRRLQQRSRRSTNSLWRLPQWWWRWWRLPCRLKVRWFPQQGWRLLTLRLLPHGLVRNEGYALCLSHLIWLPCCLCAVCLSRVHFVFYCPTVDYLSRVHFVFCCPSVRCVRPVYILCFTVRL